MNSPYDKKFLDGALRNLGNQIRDAGYVDVYNDYPIMIIPAYAAKIRRFYDLPDGPFTGEVLLEAIKVVTAYCLDIITAEERGVRL